VTPDLRPFPLDRTQQHDEISSMRFQNMLRLLLACVFVSPISSAVQATSWLDRSTPNWNKAGNPIPKTKSSLEARCRILVRSPESFADRQLAAAGWILFGPLEIYGGTAVIHGMADADGMCRPNQFHVFVFVEDHYAGTLTPFPMDARSDGGEARTWLTSASTISVEFSRYRKSDPMCCASGKSPMTYTVTRTSSGPLVIPDSTPAMIEWQPPNK